MSSVNMPTHSDTHILLRSLIPKKINQTIFFIFTGLLFSTKNVPKSRKRLSVTTRYYFLLEQKNSTQVSFSVNFDEYNYKLETRPLQKSKFHYKSSILNLRQLRSYISVFSVNYKEEELVNETLNLKGFGEFNRVYLTFASEREERFYGFGEQFSCMEFKGKKVPILVQEQGIGRGDQPITFAANLVSHRYIFLNLQYIYILTGTVWPSLSKKKNNKKKN